MVDGRRIEPIQLSQTRLAFFLPADGREIALRSKVFIPAHTVADSADTRTLGLCVGRLQIDGAAVVLGGAFGPGWHEAVYADGCFSHRWTSGATPLPAGARVVIVDLAGVGSYWSDTPAISERRRM